MESTIIDRDRCEERLDNRIFMTHSHNLCASKEIAEEDENVTLMFF